MQLSRTEATRAALANSSGLYGQSDVNTSASAISTNAKIGHHGVAVRSLSSNTAVVWVGFDDSVSATTGVELHPGEGVTLNIDQADKVFAYTATATQRVSYIVT